MSKNDSADVIELEKTELEISFIPIVCSAPLIYAHRHGFFENNGLSVNLRPAPGWSGIKELIVYGKVDAAHMLSPMPLACNLGIDGKKADIRLAAIQNVNGQALTLAKKHLGIKDVRDMKGFTLGVPYHFSMHYYLLCLYLAENGVNPLKDVTIKEVAPPRMPYYIKKGWVDGVFAPEPFNQIPVHRNIGFIHILSKDIWQGHPCCSFATTQDFIDSYPNTYQAMLKSVLEAELALHEADVEQKRTIAREISDPQHLNQDDPVPVEQALAGDFPDGRGEQHKIPDRIDFIPYPWVEYGSWMLSQMQRWGQLASKVDYREVVESVFQTDAAREIAESLGFAPEDKARLEGVSPFTGKDPFTYMTNQPYSAFQEQRRPLKKHGLRAPARSRLSQIIALMADVAGGRMELDLNITSHDEIGLLEQMLNEMVLNIRFTSEALAEQRDKLEEEVTERKQAEEKIKEQNEFLNTVIESLTHPFYVINAYDYTIKMANSFARLGSRSENLTCYALTHKRSQPCGDREHICPLKEVKETRKPVIVEHIHYDKDGNARNIEVHGYPIFDNEGNVIQMIEYSLDITERKQAEEQLQRYAAELEHANEELKTFTYAVSHDLRAPLVNMRGFAAELRFALELIGPSINTALLHLDKEQRQAITKALEKDVPEALDFIDSSAIRMDRFINALLKLSRLGRRELKLEPIDMDALVQTTLKTLAHQIEERQVKMTVGHLPEMVADRISMEQIMGNILDNAVKYLDPNRPGEIEITAERGDDETTFRLRDNGRGISEEDMDKVFALFRRAGRQDVPGEGMGLLYVQTLVRRHGGRIWCESELGVGTTFTFTISNNLEKGGKHD